MEGQRKGGLQEGRKEESERSVYGIIQGNTFIVYLRSSVLQLFLSKLWSSDHFQKRSQCCPSNHRVLPLGHFSCLWLQCPFFFCPRGHTQVYIVTSPSVMFQEFFPALIVILSTALDNHYSSDLACDTIASFPPW